MDGVRPHGTRSKKQKEKNQKPPPGLLTSRPAPAPGGAPGAAPAHDALEEDPAVPEGGPHAGGGGRSTAGGLASGVAGAAG